MNNLGLSILALVAVARSANVIERLSVQDGALCDDRIPAYLVTDGHKLVGSDNKIIYKDVDEQECKNMCTDNKDDQGNQVMCSSFTYNSKERSCSVHRSKAMPVGKLELKPLAGNRYYEKFCLPEGTPADCGEKAFFRADQAVLVGFAKNVSHTKHLTTCIQACIEMSAECRSAMFFGGAGECILSVASAQDAPDVFAEEDDEEHVVFFENGCVLDNQIRIQKKHSISQQKPAEVKKPVVAKPANASANAKPANASKVEEKKVEEKKPAEPSEEKKSKSEEEAAVIVRSKKPSSKEHSSEEAGDSEAKVGAGDESEESSTKSPDHKNKEGSGKRKSGSGKEGPKKKLLQNAILSNGVEEAWGPWSEECRSFDERRPCTNGNRVGFQSRQCLRTPFECQGPFFRYCIAPC